MRRCLVYIHAIYPLFIIYLSFMLPLIISYCCSTPTGSLTQVIHEDGTKCLKDHFVKVHKVHGTVVDGLGNRNGERRLKAVWSVKSKNHGGARPTRKQRLEEIETNGFGQVWVHRHARAEWHKCAGIEEEEVSMEESDSCDYCLHPDVCLCAFSKVTPGCCNKYNSE
jgi:hypothetical protein